MTIWQAVTWDVARAGGFVSYILLVLSVVAGLALSMQLQSSSRWPRLVNNELHNFLALLGTVFLVVHVLAVWVDPFVKFGWREVFIPFVSQYNAPWMAIGIVAMYVGIAVGISTLLRPRIGYKVWRYIHYLTFGVFILATFHGIGTGTDTLTWWGLFIYLVSIVLVGGLFCWRVFAAVDKSKGKNAQVQPPARMAKAAPVRRG